MGAVIGVAKWEGQRGAEELRRWPRRPGGESAGGQSAGPARVLEDRRKKTARPKSSFLQFPGEDTTAYFNTKPPKGLRHQVRSDGTHVCSPRGYFGDRQMLLCSPAFPPCAVRAGGTRCKCHPFPRTCRFRPGTPSASAGWWHRWEQSRKAKSPLTISSRTGFGFSHTLTPSGWAHNLDFLLLCPFVAPATCKDSRQGC